MNSLVIHEYIKKVIKKKLSDSRCSNLMKSVLYDMNTNDSLNEKYCLCYK